MKRSTTLALILLLAQALFAQTAFVGVYHEASCPSVDQTQMLRMTRGSAVAKGYLPAPDCHPQVRARYLGIISGDSGFTPSTDRAKTVDVRSYTRADGTRVEGHQRAAPRRD